MLRGIELIGMVRAGGGFLRGCVAAMLCWVLQFDRDLSEGSRAPHHPHKHTAVTHRLSLPPTDTAVNLS